LRACLFQAIQCAHLIGVRKRVPQTNQDDVVKAIEFSQLAFADGFDAGVIEQAAKEFGSAAGDLHWRPRRRILSGEGAGREQERGRCQGPVPAGETHQ
jgi:hypothetical protein